MPKTAKKPSFPSEAYPPGLEIEMPLTFTLVGAGGMKGTQVAWFKTMPGEVSDHDGKPLGTVAGCMGGIIEIHDLERSESWAVGPDTLWYMYQHYRAQLKEADVKKALGDDTVRAKWHKNRDARKAKRRKVKEAEERAAKKKQLKRESAAEGKRQAARDKKWRDEDRARKMKEAKELRAKREKRPQSDSKAPEPKVLSVYTPDRKIGPLTALAGDTSTLLDRYLTDPDGTMAEERKRINQTVSAGTDGKTDEHLYTVEYNGWLNKKAEYQGCLYGNHAEKAYDYADELGLESKEIPGNGERALEEAGWAKLTKGEWYWRLGARLTKAQKKFIAGWCTDHDEEVPADLWD